jgi:hypothetical protein
MVKFYIQEDLLWKELVYFEQELITYISKHCIN